MRKFTLTNARGETFDVMNWSSGAFLNLPQGLGASYKTETVMAGGYWLQTDRNLNEPAVSGEMIFRTYEIYNEFMKFIGHGPLVLGYTPEPDMEEYYIDCEVESLGKSERDSRFGVLYCPISFKCFSPWYGRTVIERTNIDTDTAKYYSYTYPYKYYDQGNGYLMLRNNGNRRAPCKIKIFGYALNPVWSLQYEGETIITGKVTAEITAGNVLVVDSTPTRMEIAEYTTDGEYVANKYASSDFNTARFIWLPVGTSYMTISHSGGNELEFEVEVRALADSV